MLFVQGVLVIVIEHNIVALSYQLPTIETKEVYFG